MSSLPGRWRLHPAGHLLEGPGGRIGLADKVTVRLVEAAGISGALRFELDLAPAPGGQGARTRPGPRGRRGSKRRPA
jgi:hypothetical protein